MSYKKPIDKRKNNKIFIKILLFIKKRLKAISVMLVIIILSILAYVFFSNLFLGEKNNIKNIVFNEENIKYYDDPYIYKFLKENIVGKNYFQVLLFELKKIKSYLKENYVIVDDIKVSKQLNGQVAVDIVFKKPKLIFSNTGQIVGSLDGKFFTISSGNTILSGYMQITIPDYIKAFSGFYFKVSEDELYYQINKIEEFWGRQYIASITYLPGGAKTIVKTTDSKEILINNSKDIKKQLEKYQIVMKNYFKFNELKQIDLGSSDDIIVKY